MNSPQQAQDLGIAVVHQHFNLVPQLSVAENLFLSQTLPRRFGLFVNWSGRSKSAPAKLLDRVGLKIDPWTEVSGLRPDESAMVAIAKAIGSDARIIILDEPTSALLPAEVSILFGHMRRLASEGHSFLYVSHRLAEVFEIADRVTVLRDGRRAGAWTREQMSRKTIIKAIVGGDKPWIDDADAGRANHGEPVFVARRPGGRKGSGPQLRIAIGRNPRLCGSARKRRRGGPRPTLRPIGGIRRPVDGAREAGHASLSARRQERGHCARAEEPTRGKPAVRRQRAREHLASEPQPFCHRSRRPVHSSQQGTRGGQEIATRLAIKMPSIEASINSLSGGNQQKAILGRWLASGAKIFMLNSPTAAVDIGAKADIYNLIREIAASGAGVIFTSTEVEEFPRVCHRVIVFRDGVVVGELTGANATEANIMHLAVGGEDER